MENKMTLPRTIDFLPIDDSRIREEMCVCDENILV